MVYLVRAMKSKGTTTYRIIKNKRVIMTSTGREKVEAFLENEASKMARLGLTFRCNRF